MEQQRKNDSAPEAVSPAIDKQISFIKGMYPFIGDDDADIVRARIHQWNVRDSKDHFENPYQIQQAFRHVMAEVLGGMIHLDPLCIRSLLLYLEKQSLAEGANLFRDAVRIKDTCRAEFKLPSSSENINSILEELRSETDSDVIKMRLAQIVIYIRDERELRSSKTTQGDVVVSQIEPNLVAFLDSYRGHDFPGIMPWLRELVSVMPKTKVFGINITDVREDIACYHENRPQDDPFAAVAEDIREQIHRHLSVRAIEGIDELAVFLRSDKTFAFVVGRYCQATREQKDAELGSELYSVLAGVRKRLSLIWNNPFCGGSPEDRTDFFTEAIAMMEDLLSQDVRRVLSEAPDGRLFIEYMEKAVDAFKCHDTAGLQLGILRHHLRKAIEELMSASLDKTSRGQTIFNLMTLDSVLENLSLIYYSDTVNSDLAKVENGNYEKAMRTLVEVALCARACGQGTKDLGRSALLIGKELQDGTLDSKGEKIRYLLADMNDELVMDILGKKQFIAGLLRASGRYEEQDVERITTKLLNGMIREKTTLLLGNLLDAARTYSGIVGVESFEQIERAEQRHSEAGGERELQVADMFFTFGPDMPVETQSAHLSWFMGGKGASLAEISRLIAKGELKSVDVPKGFGLGVQTWPKARESQEAITTLEGMLLKNVEKLEARTGKRFGDPKNPLLLAARSGAIVSMPGLLATVAHIGLNPRIVKEWADGLEEPARAYHAYIRFLFNYAISVSDIPQDGLLKNCGAAHISDLFTDKRNDLAKSIVGLRREIERLSGQKVPDDLREQLLKSVLAVFRSYEKDEAQRQVRLQHIPMKYQTACIVQECLPVTRERDCSGVLFTRNPRTGGECQIEYVSQFGEDLVGGRITPKGNQEFSSEYPGQDAILQAAAAAIERRYSNPNDIEFAIRDGNIYIVQTRKLILSPVAKVVVYFHLYEERIINLHELLQRTLHTLRQPIIRTFIDEKDRGRVFPIAKGQPVSGGAVCGRLVADEASLDRYRGENIIFITKSNVPGGAAARSDIQGYISEEGGVTSHAALISSGKMPCVVGVKWDRQDGGIDINGVRLEEGEFVTLDANDGFVIRGQLPVCQAEESDSEFMRAKWEISRLASTTNVR